MTLTDSFWKNFELDLQEVKIAYLNWAIDHIKEPGSEHRHLFLWDHQKSFCLVDSRYERAFANKFDILPNYYYNIITVILIDGGAMKAYSITPKGQVTIPVSIREELNLKPGDKILYEKKPGGIFLKPVKKNMLHDYGFLKVRRKLEKDLGSIRKAVREKLAARRHPK